MALSTALSTVLQPCRVPDYWSLTLSFMMTRSRADIDHYLDFQTDGELNSIRKVTR